MLTLEHSKHVTRDEDFETTEEGGMQTTQAPGASAYEQHVPHRALHGRGQEVFWVYQ